MKLYTILSLSLASTAFSQNLSYSIFLRDVCKDSVYKSTYFRLVPIQEEITAINGLNCLNGTCDISITGRYQLLLIENIEDYPTTIEFSDLQAYSDTFNISTINELFGTTAGGYYGFNQCDNLCNGLCQDYYNNGQVRIQGYFVNGIPKGDLKIFYRDGTLKELREYSNQHRYKRVTYFGENGQIIKIEKKGFKSQIIDPTSPSGPPE